MRERKRTSKNKRKRKTSTQQHNTTHTRRTEEKRCPTSAAEARKEVIPLKTKLHQSHKIKNEKKKTRI
jgi:hypothetical protein